MLLGENRLLDHRAIRPDFRIRVTHVTGDHLHELVHERLVHAEMFAVTHRAPHDLAQDVAPEFI